MKTAVNYNSDKKWTLFVGGTEVNDYLMDFVSAERLADDYIDDGYDQVVAYNYDTNEEVVFC